MYFSLWIVVVNTWIYFGFLKVLSKEAISIEKCYHKHIFYSYKSVELANRGKVGKSSTNSLLMKIVIDFIWMNFDSLNLIISWKYTRFEHLPFWRCRANTQYFHSHKCTSAVLCLARKWQACVAHPWETNTNRFATVRN